MTLSTLQTLASTDEGRERIRVMVAELSEARCVTEDGGAFWHYITKDGRDFGDPLEDLNACAEFEAGLTDEEHDSFMAWLILVCEGKRTVSARALHRCIAFILTKTKGEE